MGEGLGAGGHATRRRAINLLAGVSFQSFSNFFSTRPSHARPRTAQRAYRGESADRQVHVPAIWEFEVPRSDAKASIRAAAAFDHVTRSDGKSAGQTVWLCAHGTS